MIESKECASCGTTFYRPTNRSRAQWDARSLCSQKCVARVAAAFPRPGRMPRYEPVLTGESYPDNGCEFSPSCLRCELPKCQYDMSPIELHRMRTERKQAVYAR